MNVATNNGDIECQTAQEIENILMCGARTSYDDIWISGKEKYPCLTILSNGILVCMQYFPNENGDMWQSVGKFDGNVTFIVGGETSEMPGNTVIPLEKAIECVREFYVSLEKPTCIDWQKL